MGNKGAAYKDTYPAATEAAAATMGIQLYGDLHIKSYYSILNQEISANNKVDIDFILQKHKEIIEADILVMYDIAAKKNFTLKHISQFPKKFRWMIQEISPTATGIKIKLLDKQKALAALGNISGVDRLSENTGNGNLNVSFDKEGENF